MHPMWIYPGSAAKQKRGKLQNITGKLPDCNVGQTEAWSSFHVVFIPIACAKQRSSASLRGLKLKWAHKLWEK